MPSLVETARQVPNFRHVGGYLRANLGGYPARLAVFGLLLRIQPAPQGDCDLSRNSSRRVLEVICISPILSAAHTLPLVRTRMIPCEVL